VQFGSNAEILWIRFKIGVFLSHMSMPDILNQETVLSSGQSLYLDSTRWQFPTYENADTFVDRLVREDVLDFNPVVDAALQKHPVDLSSRTMRHHFLQTTGMSQKHIEQVQRARQAEQLLRQGKPILDVVYEAGYYDQPHLTRSLKKYIGYTPAAILYNTDDAAS
jgi:AraC-like DNA-binding protein